MNKEIQTKQIEMQILGSQIGQIQKQIQQIDNNVMEIDFIKASLDDLKKMKKGSEIFAPIANGIFIKANLKETDELAVNVGGSTVVNKNIEQTKKLLDDQVKEISKSRKEMMESLEKLSKQAASMEKEIMKSTEK